MSPDRIGIYWNSSKPGGLDVAGKLMDMLGHRGVEPCLNSELSRAIRMEEYQTETYDHCSMLIVLGGDGTILSALDYAIPNDIPIFGINLGRLGFLTEIEREAVSESVVDRLLNGEYAIDARTTMMVEGWDHLRYFALNDIAVSRATPQVRLLAVEYRANGTLVDRISGDGLIIATATGSTAYSLSAGGPVVLPGLDCFVLTPICPHTLNARPVVVSADERITVRVVDDRGGAQAVLDGRRMISMNRQTSEITVCRSERQARFIRLEEKNYFGLLRTKLSEWTH